MSRLHIPTWLKDSSELVARIRVRDHCRFLGRAFRVPEGCVLLADGTNAVIPQGKQPPPDTDGLLIKTWGQQISLDCEGLLSSDDRTMTATLTLGFVIAGQEPGPLGSFRASFGADGSLIGISQWLKKQLLQDITSFCRHRTTQGLIETSGLTLLNDLYRALRPILHECRCRTGLRASLVEIWFNSPEYADEQEEVRRSRHEHRKAALDVECRRTLDEIAAKVLLNQELTRLDVEMAIRAREHVILQQGRLLEIEEEKLWANLEKQRLERIQAAQAVEEASSTEARYLPQDVLDRLNALTSLPARPPSSSTALWALFAAFMVVAACAVALLVVSSRSDSTQRLEKLIIDLSKRTGQATQASAPPERVVAVVSVFLIVGRKPYDREIAGNLQVTDQAVMFKCGGSSADADHEFRIALTQVKDIAWRGEREPVLFSTTAGLEYGFTLNPSEPHSEVQTGSQLYKLLSDAKDNAASSSSAQ